VQPPSSARPWPAALQGTPAAAVIDRAIDRRRLGHSLLLHGDNPETLEAVACAIADRLLNEKGSAYFPPDRHPDCFALRPTGKMRFITADATRELISKVQKSAIVSHRKIAIIHEADRMNAAAANIFLKTLEEPPGHTTLLLLTTHPYALLPTIRSRCLHFRFPAARAAENLSAEALAKADGAPSSSALLWSAWLADYRTWLARIAPTASVDRRLIADHIFTIYGLVARFGFILDMATDEAWLLQKDSLPPDVDDDQRIAIETGLANGLRARFFAEIEESTRIHARSRLEAADGASRRAFTGAIARLEHGAGLLRVNLNESAALEDFLLASLRLWSGR
jgi:DNA polymerase-3 subunit delta'